MQPIKTNVDVWVPWRRSTKQTRLRLLCFPHAGSSASAFYNWSAALPGGVEICPVELPGRGRRFGEAPCRDLTRLIGALSNELRPLFDVPFAIFGHSMGALLAYRLAQRLRDDNLPEPVQLFLSGRRAPQLTSSAKPIHELPDPELASYLRTLNGIPEAVFENPELLSSVLPILRADLDLIASYTYCAERPLDCPICAFAGLEDPSTTIEEIRAWREHTAPHKFSLYLLSGDHFFVKNPEFMKTICGRLEHLIQQL